MQYPLVFPPLLQCSFPTAAGEILQIQPWWWTQVLDVVPCYVAHIICVICNNNNIASVLYLEVRGGGGHL